MKLTRIAIIGVALIAGGAAALLAGRTPPPPEQAPVIVAAAPTLETTEVLVAINDIPMGSVLNPDALAWRQWPKEGAENFIQRSAEPGALEEMKGAIARQPFVSGEPIRMQKVIKANGTGFMSAILPAGMRAIATEISAETGAGGFILPNDRVDVLLTRRDTQSSTGKEEFTSSTILTNVRVLAIDQTIGEKDGQQVVVGRTATLELLPKQAEVLALARQMGTLSLALRSLADSNPNGLEGATPELGAGISGGRSGGGNELTVVRFGVATQASGR